MRVFRGTDGVRVAAADTAAERNAPKTAAAMKLTAADTARDAGRGGGDGGDGGDGGGGESRTSRGRE